ncbi:hypothetical protein JD844_003341 [Phrynosoma platyrhinos]|uniref:Carrier domain-containing protein n=1 Tax=Phrynosoma platyrhinos TaxID=52577 RepID=A0ABQ7TCV8_PHRPL|nr:hypothetical protein JD844_003341 [Phrynosoma platyrhinos]
METQDEIAIVGIGCNFPGGEGIDNFWQVLIEGKNYVQEIPPERFDTRDWFNAFDNRLFGINDVEAECMDPQQKLLLECTYRALEDAGVTREDMNGSKTGVFIGMMNRDYLLRSIRSTTEISHYDATGAAMSIAANRISYTFNLTGPSIAIDTACSSFHYALHLALQAIKQGDCEAALCGAVNCIIEPQVFIPLSKAKLISPEGVSKPFSTKGDGYGRGEGCGAQEDFSKIWGVISMSTINHNGRSVTPITRPSQQQQENLLLSIYPAHVNPSMIQYIEAHGTGTPAGDPVEAESIGNVIGKKRASNLPPLKIGSVKGNIGHTESAAGAAGLIKVLLMMHHGKIVPSLHFSESTTSINTKKLNLSVPTTVEKWDESSEFGRIAGVNSFGVGGTNAHVVVRQFKQTQVLPSVKRLVELVPISAASGNSLKLTMEDTARYLKTRDGMALSNLAYTSACRRSHVNYKYRKAFVVSSFQQLERELRSGAEMETAPAKKPLQLIFVFSGNGLNLKGVFETLSKSEPVFRDKSKDKDNIAFVEIGPKRALQRYIQEILGIQTKVFPSLQIFKEHETLLNLVKALFELGLNPNWEHIFEGYQGIPTAYPRYQFDHKKLLSFNNMVRQTTERPANLNHLLIHNVSNDNTEFRTSVSQALTPYLYEHKHNGIAIVPGAFFVELALAAVLTVSRPKVPVNLFQLSIKFTLPCVLSEGSLDLKVKLDSQKEGSDFKILSSSSGAVFALGRIKQNPEVCLEEKSISYKDIFQRCKTFVSKDAVYETLSRSGFQYGSAFKQVSDVFYSEELKEAITNIKVNKQTREEMHEFFIHPVLLDCFLHMTGLMTLKAFKNAIGFPSSINSFVIVRPLEEEMMIYLKVNKSVENYFEFCGCFTDKHGFVLVEMKRVGITVIKETSKNENNLLFENKWKETEHSPMIQTSGETLRFTVFADKMGVSQQLKKYLHKNSNFLMYEEWEKLLECRSSESPSQDKVKLDVQECSDVLFMWGIQRLNERNSDTIVASLSKCCEAFRQLIIALKEKNNSQSSIKIITYRTVDKNVDHINPGFALYGMARCCMLEATGITFQMIDISSTSTVDILALVDVLGGYKAELYPEIWINQGNIYTSEIRRTQIKDTIYNNPSQSIHHHSELEPFSLYTCEPNEARDIFAELADNTNFPLDNHSVELEIEKINIHTEDYYPVSVCSSNFGKTLYWNSQTVGKYKLLALDYSGTVVATGTEVKKLKVGDHIVSCYPVAASSKVIIPETVCFNTRKFPCFEMVPCMSFFRIAWEIVHLMLPKIKQNGSLGIISTEPESVLCKVLTHSAQEAGLKTVCTILDSTLEERVAQCNALVFLPPLERLPKDILAHLLHLQDVVVIQDNYHSECLRSLIGSDHENFKIHVISLATIFQKASLKHSQKAFSNWLKSIQLKQFKNMSCSIFQHAENSEMTDTAAASTFARRSVSLAVLKGDMHKSCISNIPMYESKKKMFQKNAVYIVTGGLTGLGFETVKFIAQNGGGCIVILSRRKPSLEKQQEISNLQNQNEWSRIVSLQCNIIFKPEVVRAMSSISKIFPNCPIKGIFHSAMVLHDGVMEALNIDTFEKVLSPKVAGAINLHCVSQGQELDYFVCYSSVSSFLGNSMQANYAAANSFLDLFCHYRRNYGLSGQSINWGALNLGVLQNQNQIQNLLESKGILILQSNEVYESLKKSLILNNPQQAVVKLNFTTFTSYYFLRYPSFKSRMSAIMVELIGNNVELLEQNVAHDLAPRKAEDYVLSLVSQLTGTDSNDIAMNTSLFSAGIDSMLAMTLQHNIFQELKVEVPLVKLLDPETTVLSLASFVEEISTGDRLAIRE